MVSCGLVTVSIDGRFIGSKSKRILVNTVDNPFIKIKSKVPKDDDGNCVVG